MNILLICGRLWPQPSNNTNILRKLIPYLSKDHQIHILASASQTGQLPDMLNGIPITWEPDDRQDILRRLIFPAIARTVDRDGFSDALQALVLIRKAMKLRQSFSFDMVIASMEPFASGAAAAYLPCSCQRFLYLMDPPGCVCDQSTNTPFRQRFLPKILHRTDLVLTTPFIQKALEDRGITANYREVGFPMIENHHIPHREPGETIELLFTGWLCSDIRSPKYFLELAKHLDSRFRITFMGKECDLLRDRFEFETGAEVVTLPQQPYQAALEAMAGADILINIGNSVPVHMPSKTLEYINARKPIVNFHKLPDCPTLHYTRRYPLCLNIFEGDPPDPEGFIRFCLESRGKTAPVPNLPECTPEYIAQVILDEIGDCYV